MSSHYTDLLAKNIIDCGYHVLTYNHILNSDNTIVSGCKVSKNVDGECFAGLGYANNILDSTEKASLSVYNQLFNSDNNLPKKKLPERHNCIVFEGLNDRTTAQDIYDLCSEYGDVIDIEFLNESVIKAIVFMNSDMDPIVKEYNCRQLDGKTLNVYLDIKNKINIPLFPPRNENTTIKYSKNEQ
jgi:hypothetical protein